MNQANYHLSKNIQNLLEQTKKVSQDGNRSLGRSGNNLYKRHRMSTLPLHMRPVRGDVAHELNANFKSWFSIVRYRQTNALFKVRSFMASHLYPNKFQLLPRLIGQFNELTKCADISGLCQLSLQYRQTYVHAGFRKAGRTSNVDRMFLWYF